MTTKLSDASRLSSSPGKLLPLELCRGLAALLVAGLHAGASIDKYYSFDIGAVHNFGAGVDFFFVLSGFAAGRDRQWRGQRQLPRRLRGPCAGVSRGAKIKSYE